MNEQARVFAAWPEGLLAMLGVDAALEKSDLTSSQLEIIRLRCSALNKCDFCIEMDRQKAMQAGLAVEEVHLIVALDELPNREPDNLLIQLADCVTNLDEEVPEQIVPQLARQYDEAATIFALSTIGQTNLWNRIATVAKFVESRP